MNSSTFSDVLIGLSDRHPDRAALESPTLRLTYRELVGLAAQVARALRAGGIGPGARVAIASRRNEDVLVQMLALWMLGAVAAPIDFRIRADGRAALARDLELAAVLEDRPVGGAGAYPSILVDAAWLQAASRHSPEPLFSPSADAPAVLVLSSGTSGERMGALIGHQQLFMRVCVPADFGQRIAGGRLLNLSPLSFCASIHNTLTALWYGATVIFFPALFGASEVARAITERGITALTTVPAVVRELTALHAQGAEPAFGGLKLLCCAGAPLSPQEKAEAVHRLSAAFVEIYASTLTGRICMLEADELVSHGASVGRVLPQVSLQVVDEAGAVLPPGQPGAVRVRSPGMTLALCGPGARRSRGDRVAGGWVYTGDIGLLDAAGYLHLMGRDSEMIIRGGENVYPAEIEAAALALRGVRQAVAVGFPAERVGEEIALFVVAERGTGQEQLQLHLRARLVPNKMPRLIRIVESLPINENGKVRYADLRAEIAA